MKNSENRSSFRKDRNNDVREVNPVAAVLLNTIKNQMQEYLALDDQDRVEGSKNLFYVGAYPADLESDSCPEDLSKYKVYQLERSVRVRRDEPERRSRLSTAILLIDTEACRPAFYLTAYITPTMIANVRVVPYNERGPVYSKAVSWDSRDDEPAKE